MKISNVFTAIVSTIIVSIAVIMSGCAGEELRYSAINYGGVHYEIENNEATATGYLVENGEVKKSLSLPDKIVASNLSFKVVAVADKAFVGGQWETVTLGANVRSVGEQAFSGCDNLIGICFEGSIPPSLPENAFDPEVYDNAKLVIYSGVDIEGTTWSKFRDIVYLENQ